MKLSNIYRLAIAAFTTVVFTNLLQAQWTVTNLHPTSSNASHSSQAYGMAGYVKPSIGRQRAAMWSGTSSSSYVDLHPSGALDSLAWGSGGGQQVGYVLSGALGQGNNATLWTGSASSRVNLHPAGWATSTAVAAAGGQQVGYGNFSSTTFSSALLWNGTAASFIVLDPANSGGNSRAEGTDGVQQVGSWNPGGNTIRAALWSGSAASHVDLHPSVAQISQAFDVSNGQQVGYARLPSQSGGDPVDVASLWNGTAQSWVNLNPNGALNSRAYGVLDGQQVGFVRVAAGARASLWSGTAASWVDLGAFLPSGFSTSEATDIFRVGDNLVVSGFGFNTVTNRTEAVIWTQAVPEPGTATLLAMGVIITTLRRRRNLSA